MKKLLSNSELFAILLFGFIALIMGGWSMVILVISAGALIGFMAPANERGWIRALAIGLVSSTVVAIATVIFNNLVSTLPKVGGVPIDSTQPVVFIVSVLLGTGMAGLIAWLRGQPNEKLRKYGLLSIVVILAVAFPFFEQDTKLLWLNAVIVAMIYTQQALGLNIVAGYAGLLDLGYVAFFAIGGYTIALLNSPQFNLSISFWLVIWAAAAAAAAFGFILGTPVLPLRGDYLALVTLGFGEIVPVIFRNLEAVTVYEPISLFISWLTQGNNKAALCLIGCGDTPANITNGIQGINPIGAPILPPFMAEGLQSLTGYSFRFAPGNYIPWYFLALLFLAVSVFFISRVRHSRLGRAWVAIREDELAAGAMGVNPVRTKLAAFMIGAMFAGIAGAYYGSYVSFISPSGFDFSISVIVLCMVILGGTGSIPGVILGGFILRLSDLLLLDKLQLVISGILQQTVFQTIQTREVSLFLASLLDLTQYKLLFFGLILVLMMLLRPEGLLPSAMSRRKGS